MRTVTKFRKPKSSDGRAVSIYTARSSTYCCRPQYTHPLSLVMNLGALPFSGFSRRKRARGDGLLRANILIKQGGFIFSLIPNGRHQRRRRRRRRYVKKAHHVSTLAADKRARIEPASMFLGNRRRRGVSVRWKLFSSVFSCSFVLPGEKR